MRQGPRDVFLNYIQLLKPNQGWSTEEAQFQGYHAWYVFSGVLLAETLQNRWEIPATHFFLLPSNVEVTTLSVREDQEAHLAHISYNDASGARLPSQCRKIHDSAFLEVLIYKTNQLYQQRQVWETNTILQATLDEVFLGDVTMSRRRQTIDCNLAHQVTQSKLKTIDWGHTKRLLDGKVTSGK